MNLFTHLYHHSYCTAKSPKSWGQSVLGLSSILYYTVKWWWDFPTCIHSSLIGRQCILSAQVMNLCECELKARSVLILVAYC